MWIYQQAWLHLGVFDAGETITYPIHLEGNGMYLFLLDGQLEINGQEINARDAYGAVEFETLQITTKAPSRILIIEVPMQFKN